MEQQADYIVTTELESSGPYTLIDTAEKAFFGAQKQLWVVCSVAHEIVGKYGAHTRELADRLGRTVATVEFYAKAWRVHEYVWGYSVPCTIAINGIATAELIISNLSMTHLGVLHSRVFRSRRVNGQMQYTPVISPEAALSLLAECVEPLASDAKRLSPQALLALSALPNQSSWFERWRTIYNKLANYLAEFGEHLPAEIREAIENLLMVAPHE